MKLEENLMRTRFAGQWWLVLLMVAALALGACGTPAAPAPAAPAVEAPAAEAPAAEAPAAAAPVSFTFWGGWTGPDADKMKAIVDQYMVENPNVTIAFETQQWSPLFTKFLAEASSGNSPDILAMHPFELGQFAELGVLDAEAAPAIGLVEADFSPIAWAGTYYDGIQYAVPLDQHMHGVYYNKDFFEAAGITDLPTTGDEFVQTAKLLTLDKAGKNATEEGFDAANIVQYGLGFNQNHHVGYQMAALIKQQGEVPFTADMTEIPFSHEAATNALTWIQDLVYTHHVTPVGEKTPTDDFVAGNIAMLIDGPWQIPTMENSGVNWGTFPYPTVFADHAVWGSAHILTFPVNKSSAETKAAAAAFIVWLEQNTDTWAMSGQLPASTVGREFAATLPGRQAFIDSMDTVFVLPPYPRAAEVFSSAQTAPFLIMEQALLLEQRDAGEVAQEYIDNMNALLGQP